jgi:hypothetical protein
LLTVPGVRGTSMTEGMMKAASVETMLELIGGEQEDPI